MVHTLPDYTTKYKMTNVFSGMDLYELAARLGSPVTWDRRGHVLFYDDFEVTTIGWFTGYSGTGGGVTLDTGHYKSGTTSVKLTTGNAIDDYAEIQRAFPFPTRKRIGLEIAFTTQSDGRSTHLGAMAYDGTSTYVFGVKYRKADQKITYLDKNSTWQDLATGIKTYEQEWNFNVMKIVVDLNTGYYQRCIFNHATYDMTDKEIYIANSTTPAHLLAIIRHRTNAAANSTIYVDDFILTQDEP